MSRGGVDKLIDSRKGKTILCIGLIGVSVINVYSLFFITLLDEDHISKPLWIVTLWMKLAYKSFSTSSFMVY